MSDREVSNLIQLSCRSLDEEEFGSFIDLCSESFHYRIVTFSEEILKEMIWLDLDREEMMNLFKTLPQHVRMQGKFRRHANVQFIDYDSTLTSADVMTSLIVVHTDLTGASRLYCSGHYKDVVSLSPEGPSLSSREVHLDTQQLGAGPHIPM